MINEIERKKEHDYLKTVLYILGKEIDRRENQVELLEVDMRKEMRYIWDNAVSDPAEIHGIYESVKQLSRGQNNAETSLKTYRKMYRSAYFARIDFDDGEEVIPVYIGIATLKDGGSFYIYDWRAPISSMFYDFTPGEAHYTLPDGREVKGKITLKRQYKIEGDKIIEIFDTDMQVLDDILSNMLSHTGQGSTKMKNIVATIQKEQNKVIRREDTDILVVQGAAGSGKTSVAMHRTAYLLYAQKGNITNSNILIISPNEVFSDYISDVLPQIGEENVYQTTYLDFVKAFLKEFRLKGTMDDVYEEIFTNQNNPNKSDFYNSIRFKYWPGYIRILEQLISENLESMLNQKDIVIDGNVVVNKEALIKFSSDYEINRLPVVEQAKRIAEKIRSLADIKFFKQTKLKNKLNRILNANINQIKAKPVYVSLYNDLSDFTMRVQNVYNELGTPKKDRLTIKQLQGVFEHTSQNISKNILTYEDVTPYLYLKTRISGSSIQRNIKHVLIDECQDYTLTQYDVASQAFRGASVTLLGDLNQSILPYASHENYEGIINMFRRDRVNPNVDMQFLNKTYRSTSQINTFARRIVGIDGHSRQQVDRPGVPVQIIQDQEPGVKSKLVKDAVALKKKYKTVAIIMKTAKECKALQRRLNNTSLQNDFRFMINGESDFSDQRIMVMPMYIAKGLEFDAVLVARANENNYPKESARLLYVACTRAMNELRVYYDDVISSLLVRTEA